MKDKLLAFVLLAFFASCQKEIEPQNGTPAGGGTTGSDYQPTSANSEWKMKSTSIGDYTIRSLGTDTTANGETYVRFDHSIGGRQYIAKKNGVYKQLANVPQAGGWVSFIYLKDAAVGSSWTSNLGPVEMRYSVAKTGLQKTVNGKQYANVIQVNYEQYAMGMKTATGEQYYAKGVGAIEGISRIDMLGVQTTIDSTYLVSSIIK